MTATIRLGFSPCPNDTFIFYALANKKIDCRGLDFELVIDDVETLNQRAMKGDIEATKVSCHAYYYLRHEFRFLSSGGALGRGCGPLVVARDARKFFFEKPLDQLTVAIPGRYTTAFLLLKLYFSESFNLRRVNTLSMPFHEIVGAVREGRADAGLIIHESRFTYKEHGLAKVIDLGEWWEKETGLPIPLGGIVAAKSLGAEVIGTIEDLIRESIRYSLDHRDEVMPYLRHHAQELSGEVIMKHVALYVNDYSIDIGDDGRAALDELLKRAERLPL
ncbi:MAG: 1,4-dihydroxy-6-naphthoate synthase [Nitrospirota bacterium]